MNTFKRKALFTAVLAGLGAAGSAEAVYLNPNGTGQVLVYPYYTVQSSAGNAWNTYLSVVNTTSRAKAVKVRVLEGKTSAEVLDFNLFLSPNDMWTAAIIPLGDGAAMVTADVSCTNPVGNLPIASGGEPFRNYLFTGDDALPGRGLDRTREGYVEMIEMGTLTGAWATAVTHGASGSPANCAVVQGETLTPDAIEPPTGGLAGTGTLINVNNGQDAGYKADALEAWSSVDNYTDAGFITPNLGSGVPTSVVIRAGDIDPATGASTAITAYHSFFTGALSGLTGGAKAVASVYMHTSVINEYVLDTGSASLTDWVITQPLKRVFVTSTAAAPPYTNVLTSSGACETIEFRYWNREEASAAAAGADFSPLPPGGQPNSLCWESNVLSIRNGSTHMPVLASPPQSNVLGSFNVTNVNVTPTFQNGWARLTFTGTNATATGVVGMGSVTSDRISMSDTIFGTTATVLGAAATFFGLPVTGFMIRTFANGSLACATGTCQGNYGSLFNHSYVTIVRP
jgi:hypothetical protein